MRKCERKPAPRRYAEIDIGPVVRGDTIELPWRFTNRDGDPIDLSDGTAWVALKRRVSDADAEICNWSCDRLLD